MSRFNGVAGERDIERVDTAFKFLCLAFNAVPHAVDENLMTDTESAESGLRKVWILTAPIAGMSGTRRFDVREHLSEAELDVAINEAQKADESDLVRRLCFVKNLYAGDVLKEAVRRVGVSPANSSRWAHAWNNGGVDGSRPRFRGGPSPKLSDEQFAELCEVLEEDQSGTSRTIHAPM